LGYEAMSRRPFMRARLQLAWGEWLRRHQRVMEARRPLRLARDAFDVLGALPWGERARQELRATGEASQRRGPTPIDHLTPQELQIAHMVADGLSNRQIAEQLYLSHRTIGAHLYRIFPKLGITSRTQMRNVLQGVTRSDLDK
jgi:DNA-binding CsgD family transcriptional regulator